MMDGALAGAKRLREGGDAPLPLDAALERVSRHLAQDPPGPRLDKAAAIMLKLLESSLSPATSSAFVAALAAAAGEPARSRDAKVSAALSPVFAAAEERVGSFDARDAGAVRALALRCVHLRRIAEADEGLEFNRRMRPLNDALRILGSAPAPHTELHQTAAVDCLEMLLELNERRAWAGPTVRAAFRVASEQRLALPDALRARLDLCTQLLHARQTAAGAVAARSYAGGPAAGAGAGAMSGKHHPLVNVSGGGLTSSARGAAVIAVPGVRELLAAQALKRGGAEAAGGAAAAPPPAIAVGGDGARRAATPRGEDAAASAGDGGGDAAPSPRAEGPAIDAGSAAPGGTAAAAVDSGVVVRGLETAAA